MNEELTSSMTVKKVAALSKLRLTKEAEDEMSRDMEEILAFARQLEQVEPEQDSEAEEKDRLADTMRDDTPVSSFSRQEMLKNAPTCTDEYLTVPKAFEQGGA